MVIRMVATEVNRSLARSSGEWRRTTCCGFYKTCLTWHSSAWTTCSQQKIEQTESKFKSKLWNRSNSSCVGRIQVLLLIPVVKVWRHSKRLSLQGARASEKEREREEKYNNWSDSDDHLWNVFCFISKTRANDFYPRCNSLPISPIAQAYCSLPTSSRWKLDRDWNWNWNHNTDTNKQQNRDFFHSLSFCVAWSLGISIRFCRATLIANSRPLSSAATCFNLSARLFNSRSLTFVARKRHAFFGNSLLGNPPNHSSRLQCLLRAV